MTLHNPYSTFDCLFLANHFQSQNESFSVQAIHLFAYLSCLLWIYKQKPLIDWGYSFVGTEYGAPFSHNIATSLKELLERGYLQRSNCRLHSTRIVEQRLQEIIKLNINKDRAECLQAACALSTAFSVGIVSSALAKEPELSRSKALPSNRFLLEETARSQLYVHFETLRNIVDQRSNDLRLPAFIWLSALYSVETDKT